VATGAFFNKEQTKMSGTCTISFRLSEIERDKMLEAAAEAREVSGYGLTLSQWLRAAVMAAIEADTAHTIKQKIIDREAGNE
jgi:hypothetical protein